MIRNIANKVNILVCSVWSFFVRFTFLFWHILLYFSDCIEMLTDIWEWFFVVLPHIPVIFTDISFTMPYEFSRLHSTLFCIFTWFLQELKKLQHYDQLLLNIMLVLRCCQNSPATLLNCELLLFKISINVFSSWSTVTGTCLFDQTTSSSLYFPSVSMSCQHHLALGNLTLLCSHQL